MSATTRRIATLRRSLRTLEAEYAKRKANWTPVEEDAYDRSVKQLCRLIGEEQSRLAA